MNHKMHHMNWSCNPFLFRKRKGKGVIIFVMDNVTQSLNRLLNSSNIYKRIYVQMDVFK